MPLEVMTSGYLVFRVVKHSRSDGRLINYEISCLIGDEEVEKETTEGVKATLCRMIVAQTYIDEH